MNDVIANENTLPKVRFRQSILALQTKMQELIEKGTISSVAKLCTLKHYFTPRSEKYGCHVYAREIFLPKGSVVIGKIHCHAHLNFILRGKVSVNTEFGKKYFEAPCTFVSEPGLKRAVLAEEDTIWTTIHLTEHAGEENLDKIEEEIISKTYEELGLISSISQLQIGEKQ